MDEKKTYNSVALAAKSPEGTTFLHSFVPSLRDFGESVWRLLSVG